MEWVTTTGVQPSFYFRSARGEGITIRTSEDSKIADALFKEISTYSKSLRYKPLFALDTTGSELGAIFRLLLLILLPFSVAACTWLIVTILANVLKAKSPYILTYLIIFISSSTILLLYMNYLPRAKSGRIIWYYRRDLPKSPLHWPTQVVSFLLLAVVALIGWYLAYRWR